MITYKDWKVGEWIKIKKNKRIAKIKTISYPLIWVKWEKYSIEQVNKPYHRETMCLKFNEIRKLTEKEYAKELVNRLIKNR